MPHKLKEESSDDDPPDEGSTSKNIYLTLFLFNDGVIFSYPI